MFYIRSERGHTRMKGGHMEPGTRNHRLMTQKRGAWKEIKE